MSLQGEKTRALYRKASQFIPHGVNSNFRYWGPDDTLVISRGEGAYIWDMDGNRYIDYRLGFGPIILGHVADSIRDGTVFAWTTPREVEVAERICRMTSVEKVRLTNTGTEATMHTLRLARAHTNRERFIKFEGQYHGMCDYFLYSTASSNLGMLGSRRSPVVGTGTSGVPKAINQYVTILPYNDVEMLERAVKAQWGDLAAIFIEPMMGNVAGILPGPEFLQTARRLCDEYGIVMVFDEVKTGFRIARGGAQEFFGVRADLVTYAKSLGNGFPVAAYGGKEEVMMTIEPGQVACGGTYAGNAVGAAAAIATLEILEKEPVIETINQRGKMLMNGIGEILSEAGIPHVVTGLPSMFGILLGEEQEPMEFRDYIKGDSALYEKICFGLIERGVQPDSDGREPWFLCYALSEEDVNETLNVFNDAVQAAL